MTTIQDIIANQPFFRGLNADQLRALAENARYRRFRANELVFHDGNLASRFYLIVSGKVALEAPADDGRQVRFQTAAGGELLGWSWMFANSIRRLQARAIEPTEVIYFAGEQLRQQCEQDYHLGYHVFRQVATVMSQRLQATRHLLLEQHPHALAEAYEWQPGEH